jgi:N-acetylated-alpha-linked acidic dipeptidase
LEDGGASYDLPSQKVRLSPPGYGSDHHAFVAHAGIAALLLEFGDQINLGAYHSIYDNFAWYQRFGDPGFKYGLATAQFNGLAVLRLASADVIPQRFGPTATALQNEVQALLGLYESARRQAAADRQDVALRATQILQDPANPRSPPVAKPVEELDLAPLNESVAAVRSAAQRYDVIAAQLIESSLNRREVHEINQALMSIERSFLRPGGLPGRPYYGNEIYAPGRLWDTVPLPAIGDALLDGRWGLAREEIPHTAMTIRGIASAIEEAARRLRTLDERGGHTAGLLH